MIRGTGPDGAEWTATMADVLTEPPPGDPRWVSSVAVRLQAARWGRELLDEPDPRGLARQWGTVGWRQARGVLERLGGWSGCPTPDLVVVTGPGGKVDEVPTLGRSGTWLWAALRSLGWDEVRAMVVRVTEPVEVILGGIWAAPVLVLGDQAAKELSRLVEGMEIVAAPDPAWHKKYKHAEGVEGYARRLQEAGLPLGPLAKDPLPWRAGHDQPDARVVLRADAPQLPGPMGALPKSVAHRRKKRPETTGVAPEKLAQARALYVSGQATLKGAAEQVGTSVERVREAARAQGWRSEREARARARGKALADRYDRAEVGRLARLKTLAMRANSAALEALLIRMAAASGDKEALAQLAEQREAGDELALPYHPTPAGVRALSQVLTALRRERPALDAAVGGIEEVARDADD